MIDYHLDWYLQTNKWRKDRCSDMILYAGGFRDRWRRLRMLDQSLIIITTDDLIKTSSCTILRI
jgi:hypothetical protein